MPYPPRCGPAAIWCWIWGVLPRALRAQSAAQVRAFEEVFKPLGLTALAIQVLTGLGMGWIYLPGFQGLLSAANPIGMLVGVKLLLLTGTAALALHARLRLIPNLDDANLSGLAWHIRGITALAIAFVVVGALIRPGLWLAPTTSSPTPSRWEPIWPTRATWWPSTTAARGSGVVSASTRCRLTAGVPGDAVQPGGEHQYRWHPLLAAQWI